MKYPAANDPHTADRFRLRRMRLAAWLAAAAVYIAIATGAVIVTTYLGVQPVHDDLDRRHSENVAQMAFASLYSLMVSGADRAQLQAAALRLENSGTAWSIEFVRGPRVAQQYGDFRIGASRRQNDALVRQAFAMARPQWRHDADIGQVAYPVIFEHACGECHAGAENGEVAGVVSMTHAHGDSGGAVARAVAPLGLFLLVCLPLTLATAYLISGRDHRP